MKKEKRGHWYLLTGLFIGLGLGIAYSWWLSPVQYIDTEPSTMAEAYKDEYRKVIAMAYQANQDIERARQRAALIDADNPSRAMAAQAQRLLAANLSPREARALAVLAADLSQQQSTTVAQSSPTAPAVAALPSETPAGAGSLPTATLDLAQAVQTATAPLPSATPTVTLTPLPTFTPRPTATPPEVQESPFALVNSLEVCPPNVQPGFLQVEVSDDAGLPLAGVLIVVTWPEGQDSFYTGLAPDINAGYADFKMQPGVTYSIIVGQTSKEVNGIQTDGKCGRKLEFAQDQ